MVTLEELLPQDHLARKTDATINFTFICDAIAHLYCPDKDRSAVYPVRLIKIMLLGYLFGISFKHRHLKKIQVNVAGAGS